MKTSTVRVRARHFVEMVAAMAVGMLVLGPFWSPGRADLAALWMATAMTVSMTVWMWHRGHPGGAIAEMSAAMYAPFLLLLLPWWAGLLPDVALLAGGHLLMLPAMVLVLMRHPGGHHAVPTGLLSRWPTALALLCTVDLMVRPEPLSPVKMLVLPLGYLVIGAFRRTLRPRPVLIRQLAALAAYVVLVGLAVVSPPVLSALLVGAGWLAHAGWDYWHHRRDAVVPRPFAEWCGVLDAVVGLTVIGWAVSQAG